MIRPLAAFLHALDAARTAGTLTRTVLVLGRQLDNAHLLVASEGARADRAEAELAQIDDRLAECGVERLAADETTRFRVGRLIGDANAETDRLESRVAELENETRDWAELSGDLAREQPAADPLPDLTDAAPPPATPDPLRETDYHRDRADSLMRTLHATEATVLDLRAACARTERELAETRAQLRQTEGAAGAHVATISALREQIAAAHRAAHAPARTLEERADIARRAWDESPPADPGPVEWDELPPAGQAAWCAVVRACDTSAAPAEQIPGVAAVGFEVCDACGGLTSDGQRTGEAEAVLLCGRCRTTAEAEEAKRADARRYDMEYDSARNVLPPRDVPPRLPSREALYAAVMRRSDEINAAADDPPPTRPSERTTRTT